MSPFKKALIAYAPIAITSLYNHFYNKSDKKKPVKKIKYPSNVHPIRKHDERPEND